MALSAFSNIFAGNPLDRASDRRPDQAWLAAQLASPESLGLAIWNGRPLVEKSESGGMQIAYLPARLAGELAGGTERLLMCGCVSVLAEWYAGTRGREIRGVSLRSRPEAPKVRGNGSAVGTITAPAGWRAAGFGRRNGPEPFHQQRRSPP